MGDGSPVKVEPELKSDTNGHIKVELTAPAAPAKPPLASSSNGMHELKPDVKPADLVPEAKPGIQHPPQPGPILVDDGEDAIALAKHRHQADLRKHHYEPPQAERPQDDWQVAYVWAFLVKFELLGRIRRLECIDDFERCLLEPMAMRPDDVFEGVLVRFLANLKPGLRNLDCTNVQHHLSSFITDQLLNSAEFTVWDRPWAPNEEARGSCCSTAPDRMELGRLRYLGEPLGERAKRNPIAKAEAKGGGLFELDWRERAKLLRQLVDWQLGHSETIRGIINIEYKVDTKTAKRSTVEGLEASVKTEPLGQDRNKVRIWSLDDSWRLYKSGNPYKRPCPIYALTSTRQEYEECLERFREFGNQAPPKVKTSNSKGKATAAEGTAHKKLLKGIDDEKHLAAKLEELLPAIEKEEGRVQRAKKRVVAAQELAQLADIRSTRTRRSTRKVDYTYNENENDDNEGPNKRARLEEGTWEGSSTRGRPVTGERRSARVNGNGAEMDVDPPDESAVPDLTGADEPIALSESGEATPSTATAPVTATSIDSSSGSEPAGKKRNKMKGYVWVAENQPLPGMDEDEYIITPTGRVIPKSRA